MSEGSMPNLKFTERKKRVASDDTVNCPACAKGLHLNSLGRHLANKHDVHRNGTPLTAAERETRKMERERRKAVKSILSVEPDDNARQRAILAKGAKGSEKKWKLCGNCGGVCDT